MSLLDFKKENLSKYLIEIKHLDNNTKEIFYKNSKNYVNNNNLDNNLNNINNSININQNDFSKFFGLNLKTLQRIKKKIENSKIRNTK